MLGIQNPRFTPEQQKSLLAIMKAYCGWGEAQQLDIIEIPGRRGPDATWVVVRLRNPDRPAKWLRLQVGQRQWGRVRHAESKDFWALRDVVDPLLGIGASQLLAQRSDAIRRDASMAAVFVRIDTATELLRSDALTASICLLEEIVEQDLPGAWSLVCQAQLGQAYLRSNRIGKALECSDRLAALSPDCPMVDRLRSHALLEAGKVEDALGKAMRLRERVGPHCPNEMLIGRIMAFRGERAAEIQAWKNAVRADPDNVEALTRLASALPDQRKAEAAGHIETWLHPQETFAAVAEILNRSGQFRALLVLSGAYCRLFPDEGLGHFHLGRALLAEGRPDEAALEFSRGLDAGGERLDLWQCRSFLLEAMLRTGQSPLQVLKSLPETTRASALDPLCIEMRERQNPDGMEQLVDSYESQYGSDGHSGYWRAEILRIRGLYEQADRQILGLLQEGVEDETLLGDLRFLRRRIWLEWGKPLEAYEKIPPRRETFAQIARELTDNWQSNLLEELLEAHALKDPTDPSLHLFRGEVHFQRNQYEQALLCVRQYRRSLDLRESPDWRAIDVEVRCLLRKLQYKDALAVAQDYARQEQDPWFEAVVRATSGKGERTFQAMRRLEQSGQAPADLYYDSDIGGLLRSHPAYEAVRETWPVPQEVGSSPTREEGGLSGGLDF
jgi:tetratricopeptide (TPR) repeat protein